MATEQPSDRMSQDHPLTVVKEEPLDEEPESSSFFYETVTKEEFVISEYVEHADTELLPSVEAEPGQFIKEEILEDQQSESESENSSRHSKTASKERPYKCTKCNRTFDEIKNLTNCVKRHNAIEEGLHKCTVCGKCCCTKQTLIKHERTHEKKQNKTLLDEIDHFNDRKLKKILKKISPDKNGLFQCPECSRTYEKRYMATQCMKRHWALRSGLYRCKFCNLCVVTPQVLSRHELRHKLGQEEPSSAKLEPPESSGHSTEEQLPFKCAACDKTFDQIEDLQMCVRKHNANELERLKCERCQKVFRNKFNLSRHKKLYCNDNRFKCSTCGRTFKGQRKANKCERKHLAIRSGLYQCKFCKKPMGTQSDLHRHELKHTKRVEKATPDAKPEPFACDVCGKRFRHKGSIKKHMQSHQDEECRFTCRKCNLRFATRVEQQTHIQRHDWGEAKHKYFAKLSKDAVGNMLCTICYRTFTNVRVARVHVFRHMPKHENGNNSQERTNPEDEADASNEGSSSGETKMQVETQIDLQKVKPESFVCDVCGTECGGTAEYQRHIKIHTKPTKKQQIKKGGVNQKSRRIKTLKCVKTEPEQATEIDNGEEPRTDENSSSFCYETVIKEELIIEDDVFGDSAEDGQEEDSRSTVGERQLMEDETKSQQQDTESHSASEKFKCDECQKIFAKKQYLKKHKKYHIKIKHECKQCNETFDDKYGLVLHNRNHFKRVKYEEFMNEKEDGVNYECLLCDKLFPIRHKVVVHLHRHMYIINGIFKCKICGAQCKGKAQHQAHMQMHKNMSDKMVIPTEVKGVHTDYDSLSNVACERSDLPLHCKTCDVYFDSTINFNIHLWKSRIRIIQGARTPST